MNAETAAAVEPTTAWGFALQHIKQRILAEAGELDRQRDAILGTALAHGPAAEHAANAAGHLRTASFKVKTVPDGGDTIPTALLTELIRAQEQARLVPGFEQRDYLALTVSLIAQSRTAPEADPEGPAVPHQHDAATDAKTTGEDYEHAYGGRGYWTPNGDTTKPPATYANVGLASVQAAERADRYRHQAAEVPEPGIAAALRRAADALDAGRRQLEVEVAWNTATGLSVRPQDEIEISFLVIGRIIAAQQAVDAVHLGDQVLGEFFMNLDDQEPCPHEG